MRAQTRRSVSDGTESRRDAAGLLLAVGLLVALGSAASAVVPRVTQAGLTSTVGVVAIAGVALVALVTGGALTVAVRAGRARSAHTREALAWFEGQPRSAASTSRRGARGEAPGDRSAERVLRVHVASLERALEGQDARLAAAVREAQRKTLLTIGALRESLVQEPGEVALNRLEAALARIGAPPAFTRPALPEGRTGSPVVFLGAPQPLAPTQAGAAAPPPVPAAAPQPEDPGVPTDDEPVSDGPGDTEPAVAPSRPAIRPVPAPVRPAPPPQGRRRFRRSTARV